MGICEKHARTSCAPCETEDKVELALLRRENAALAATLLHVVAERDEWKAKQAESFELWRTASLRLTLSNPEALKGGGAC